MRRLAAVLIACAASAAARATSFIPQASFSVAGSTVAGMDRDAAGNLYVLARTPGSASAYTVASYQTPAMTPEFAFTVNVTTPMAFAVEANGVVDLLDSGGSLTLTRYDNTGAVVSQATDIIPGFRDYFGAAIDKNNGVFYLSYPYAVIEQTGDFSFKILYEEGEVSKYDFAGQKQTSFFMPGRTSLSTSCYTPSIMAVDSAANLWVADPICAQLLEYTPQGAQAADNALAYPFVPKTMWTGPNQSLFVTDAICDGPGCPQLFLFDAGGGELYSISTASVVGAAWDSRILYAAAPAGGTIQRFILDAPPSAPVPSSPQGFSLQHSSEATLSWQASSAAQGDAVAYSVYVGTSARSLAYAGDTTQSGFATAPLAFGTTYFWQVTAQDSYLGLPVLASTGAVVGFGLDFLDSPPGTFAVVSGSGTEVTRSSSAALGWTPAADAYGDPIIYTVAWTQLGLSSGSVATQSTSIVLNGLAFGATVYWSVTACDPYGECTPMSGGTQAYDPVFLNPPPPVPGITSGVGLISEHALAPSETLAWSAASDSLGDPTSYRVEMGTAPSLLAPVAVGTATSYAWTGLAYGTTYYWAVSAENLYGGASTSAVQAFQLALQDSPPGAFAVIAGTGTVATRSTSELLTWGAAQDAYGDTVTYTVSLSTRVGGLAAVAVTTSTSFLLAFQYGTTYYWTVAATDPFDAATAMTGGAQSFLAQFLDSPPAMVRISAPAVTTTMRGTATVAWQAVTNAEGDPTAYTFFFGDAQSGLVPVAEFSASSQPVGATAAIAPRVTRAFPVFSQTQVSGSTISVTLSGLAYDHPYLLQIQAADPYGSTSLTPLQSFSIAPESGFPAAYNYPNPFSPGRGGTNIVFNAPASGFAQATVEIYSEWQDLLFRQTYTDIPPGVSQVPFNGLDRRGRSLFNGSYICRVRFSGPDQQVVFYMAVVK